MIEGLKGTTAGSLVLSVEERADAFPGSIAIVSQGEAITYGQLNVRSNRVANGLRGLGIDRGERVAIMLPNVAEFVYCFLGILKIGAVAVPFNTLYKGGEILHILKDSGARALIALTNFAPMINELRPELPHLEHVILTGERNLLFADPENTAFVQLVLDKTQVQDRDEAYKKLGQAFVKVLKGLGVSEVWYKHRGSLRVGGDKIASFVISAVEGVALVTAVVFLGPLDPRAYLQVVWAPPEIRDKVLEPMTSVEKQTGTRPSWEEFKKNVAAVIVEEFGVEIKEGGLTRDERFSYEKLRSLAYKAR